MKIYAVVPTDDTDQGAGLFTDRKVAEIALKIVQMTIDEQTKIVDFDVDEHAEELAAGLLPWFVSVDLDNGRVCGKPKITLCWPPHAEGIIFENDWIKEYGLWAKNQNEVKMKLPHLKKVVDKPYETEAEPEDEAEVETGG